MDKRNGVVLVLLDLSAAFDTIDHSILQDRLNQRIGLEDITLRWFRSYHNDRTQSIRINNVISDPIRVLYGAPQGSIMGPEEYKIYTLPVGDIFRKHNIEFHTYADDTGLYVTFSLTSQRELDSAIQRISACVADVKTCAHFEPVLATKH